LKSNHAAIYSVTSDIVEAQIGSRPYLATSQEQAAYDQLSQSHMTVAQGQVATFLAGLLARTGGVLTERLLAAGLQGPTAIDAALNQLNPLLDALTAGHGPTGLAIAGVEEEAMSLVYRTDVATVQKHWPNVLGFESGVPVKFCGPLSMTWTAARHESTESFDYAGLQHVLHARAFAAEFTTRRQQGMRVARSSLKTRVLTPAAERKDLVKHLGVLLALSDDAPLVAELTAEALESFEKLTVSSAEFYPAVLRLRDFFCEDLVEGLRRQGAAAISVMSEDDASLLAERFGFQAEGDNKLTGRQQLTAAVKRTSELVLPLFQKWATAEEAKFKLLLGKGAPLQLSAVVTKHPAAFMARAGMGLCTSADYDMWREGRHAHLVCFDSVARRMAGFAYLYVEQLPSIDAKRPGLVIRAVNTTDDLLAEYSEKTILAEFFRVAIEFAERNDLAHVSFCPPGGMHLMSNRSTIEDAVKAGYIKAAKSGRLVDGRLEPRPTVRQPVEVSAKFSAYSIGHEIASSLFVIWTSEAAEGNPS